MDNFLPGSASLVDCVDKKLFVMLRDGRKLYGILRAYDQFANLVLQDTVERAYTADAYGDEARGVYVIRGENVVLLGEVDLSREDATTAGLRHISFREVMENIKAETEANKKNEHTKQKMLHEAGFSTVDTDLHDAY
ncbi:hypothetical protein SmJEL517_g05408 [Synchytrium microbalum]|uniref:U6 snRNA-associated Sm-like protein LSm1 n=1 Tax=Synchytrium microbalum TaxID=1806994 RepID=A0A507BP66_9FUNG|nr:uncharacterized protein SmJEL517_g05408 [Synchytrium microbalum]TPX31187.1 hypothetical protein SmJEL517_g05408 [Synchytrium microbalum]